MADTSYNGLGMPPGFGGRSEREKQLPPWIWSLLDAARSGYDERTGRKLTQEETGDIIQAWTGSRQ